MEVSLVYIASSRTIRATQRNPRLNKARRMKEKKLSVVTGTRSPLTPEGEAGGSLEFRIYMDNIARPHLKEKIKGIEKGSDGKEERGLERWLRVESIECSCRGPRFHVSSPMASPVCF